jgi:hypothetical protein
MQINLIFKKEENQELFQKIKNAMLKDDIRTQEYADETSFMFDDDIDDSILMFQDDIELNKKYPHRNFELEKILKKISYIKNIISKEKIFYIIIDDESEDQVIIGLIY